MSRFKDSKFVNYKETERPYNSGVFAIGGRGRVLLDQLKSRHLSSQPDRTGRFAAGSIKRINSVGYSKRTECSRPSATAGVNQRVFAPDDGKFWFPTQDGIAVVDPLSERSNPMPPTVVIEDMSVERSPVDFRNGIKIEAGKGHRDPLHRHQPDQIGTDQVSVQTRRL